MRLKDLKYHLSKVQSFRNLNLKYEQYITPFDIAAELVFTAHMKYDDIENKNILDLCCGTGMLGIASSFFNPSTISFADICKDALSVSQENCDELFVDGNFFNLSVEQKNIFKGNFFDTCLLNPPFGMRKKGIDMKAIDYALSVSKVVYILSSRKSREYYQKKIKNIDLLAEIKYDLPKTYNFHRKNNKVIEVDLYRIKNA